MARPRRTVTVHQLVDTLVGAAAALNSTLPHVERLAALCRATVNLLGCGRSSIFLRGETGYRGRANYGNPADIVPLFDALEIPFDHPGIVEMAASRKYLLVKDPAHSALIGPELARRFRIRSIVVAPVLDAEELIGFFTAEYNERPGSFSPPAPSLVMGLAGLIAMSVATERDEKRRRRAEQELRAREEWFRALVECSYDGVCVSDSKSRWLYVSPAIKVLGYDPAESVGRNWVEVVHPDDRADVEAAFARVLAQGSGSAEFRARHRDGSWRWIEVFGTNRVDDPNVRGVVSNFRDVTERKRAQAALQATEERFRNFAEASDAVIRITSPSNREVFYVSPAYERIWGRSRETLSAEPLAWMDAVHPEDRPRVLAAAQRIAEGSAPQELYRIVRPDGSTRWIRDTGFAIRDASGRTVEVGGIAHDVSDLVEAEEALRGSADRLKSLSQRLLQVQEEERRAVARELHDQLGQLLTALRLNVERLHGRAGDELSTEIDDSLALIDLILDRLRNLALELRPSILDDLGLVAALQWQLKRTAAQAGFTAEFAADPIAARLPVDVETACFRVAREALTNAARHATARRVSIELRQRSDAVEMVIRDDGIGFDAGAAAGHAVARASMGLLTMRERVELLGGSFSIRSAPDRGTEVRASLPAAAPAAQERAR